MKSKDFFPNTFSDNITFYIECLTAVLVTSLLGHKGYKTENKSNNRRGKTAARGSSPRGQHFPRQGRRSGSPRERGWTSEPFTAMLNKTQGIWISSPETKCSRTATGISLNSSHHLWGFCDTSSRNRDTKLGIIYFRNPWAFFHFFAGRLFFSQL